jgi:hypothetical protein
MEAGSCHQSQEVEQREKGFASDLDWHHGYLYLIADCLRLRRYSGTAAPMPGSEGDAAMVAGRPHCRRLSSFGQTSSSSRRQVPSRPTASSELPEGAGSDGPFVGHPQMGVGYSLDIG